jgi:hypothetical protein
VPGELAHATLPSGKSSNLLEEGWPAEPCGALVGKQTRLGLSVFLTRPRLPDKVVFHTRALRVIDYAPCDMARNSCAGDGRTDRMNGKVTRSLFSWISLALFACFAIGVARPWPAAAEESNQPISVQTNQQVFDTMCALDAAGFDANSTTIDMYPPYAALRARLLQLDGPATQALRDFYRKHEFANSDETLSPFLSFALVVAPPDFSFIVPHNDIPPAVISIASGPRLSPRPTPKSRA